ncbi:hypothetical protein LSH36_486g02016 [Paralvinella palmiformis]|uniref:ABC transporter domain-containing protein n=1 Tax=Paralvinella palmiformis TaxID=53620 RepID=A0AAD9JA13_9ANNE|nr:hypothetical protein LSH36_486g02016 [Paralvinella palmiformis]
MAVTCHEIIEKCFPNIDKEFFNYICGVLEDGTEDFESADDLYEALGTMLTQVAEEKEDGEIREICDRLFHVMKDGCDVPNDKVKILDAPVHIGDLVAAETNGDKEEDENSIWIAKRDKSSKVDPKKLEKAEAKLRDKQGKRGKDYVYKTNSISLQNEASASQQSNRKFDKMESAGTNKSYDIRIENFDISFGEKTLLKSANLILSYGRRYGLVGRNGIGKTTLLRMINSRSLRIPSHITVLHVEQEVVGDDTKAIESVLECDLQRTKLLQEEKEITTEMNSGCTDPNLNNRLSEVYQQLEAMEADKAPAKAAMILAGLGFSTSMQKQCTRPDLLLLDEPTNMLDMKAIIWLEDYLQTWSSTLLVVSHDREFLNIVATDIFHLNAQVLDLYKGDYEAFIKTRTERLKNQKREYDAQKQYRDHIQVFIDRFRYNANRASQVQSKLKLLEKLPELKPPEKDSDVVIRFPEVEKLSPPILQLDEMSFHYNKDRPIFSDVSLNANMESRICIVGENGAGKTTLLKILLGDLQPVSGLRHGHRGLRIGYFSQHHVDQLEMNLNSVEMLAAKFPGKTTEEYRAQLGSFGVSGDLALRPVASLSGGQKSRVAFSQMCMANPNFFILDEPTNHLDMETIEALGKALYKFKGGVILVSHDARLIRMICKELWICRNQNVESLEGGIDQYRKIVEEELAAQK